MILGSPQILRTLRVGGKLVASRALSNTNPGSLKPDSRDPETETGDLETERVHRIHGTLETGLHMMLRSLVAPSRGAGGFLISLGFAYDFSFCQNYGPLRIIPSKSTKNPIRSEDFLGQVSRSKKCQNFGIPES